MRSRGTIFSANFAKLVKRGVARGAVGVAHGAVGAASQLCAQLTMAEKPREIVDAHMHLWSPETRPWLEDLRKKGHPAGKFGEALSQAKLATDVTFCRVRGYLSTGGVLERRERIQCDSCGARRGCLAWRSSGRNKVICVFIHQRVL